MRYQQLAHRLRWSNGPGKGDTVSERPRDSRTREYLDEPDGTVVDIPEGAPGVDIEMLLKVGAIAPLAPPAAKASPRPAGNRGRGAE